MKHSILVKHHKSVQLAHLYEHLFMRAVNEFFSEKGLWRYLDYGATGKTYEQGGLIIIDIVFYTDEAMKYCDAIENIAIDLGEDNRNLAFSFLQILAEEEYEIVTMGARKVIQQLEVLSDTPWQQLNNVDVIASQTIRRSSTPIYMATNAVPKAQKIPLSLTLDAPIGKQQPELLPLFAVVSEILLQNISYRIGLEYGLYVNQLTNKPGTCTAKLLILKRRAGQLDADGIVAFAESIQKRVTTVQTIRRIVHDLQSVDYQTHYYQTPSYEDLIEHTGVLVGQKGWRHIAVTENIRLLLEHSTFEVKIGRRHASYRVHP